MVHVESRVFTNACSTSGAALQRSAGKNKASAAASAFVAAELVADVSHGLTRIPLSFFFLFFFPALKQNKKAALSGWKDFH